MIVDDDFIADDSTDDDHADEDYVPNEKSGEPKLYTTAFLNDLCRDLKLSKDESMLRVSWLKEGNLVEESVRISAHQDRDLPYSAFFEKADGLTYCEDSAGLINSMGISYNSEYWRLFIDSEKKPQSYVAAQQAAFGAYQLQSTFKGDLRRLKSHHDSTWSTGWLYQIHVLLVFMG